MTLCRECGKRAPMTRGFGAGGGLCWHCHSSPGLSDAEILALPVQPFGDEEEPPPPYEPEPDPPKVGDWAAQWARAAAAGYELDDSTAPDAIAATQRADVAEALGRLGPGATAEAIADDVLLPVWTVRRRLAELGHGTQEGAA